MLSSDIHPAIDYHITAHKDGTVLLELSGDLDLATAPIVQAALRQVTSEPPPLLVIDLRAVTFLDSAGVLLLLQAYRRQRTTKQSLRLVLNPQQGVYRVLVISGLLQLTGIEWDTEVRS
jgi:anti-sigma B factor antagonist